MPRSGMTSIADRPGSPKDTDQDALPRPEHPEIGQIELVHEACRKRHGRRGNRHWTRPVLTRSVGRRIDAVLPQPCLVGNAS